MKNFKIYINGIEHFRFSLKGETAKNYYKLENEIKNYIKSVFNINCDFEIYEVID